MSLEKKISILFEGKVVKKSLSKSIKTNAVVPTYVLEYLLGQHCASFDQEIVDEGMLKVRSIIANNYVNRDEAELIKTKISDGRITKIIDRVQGTFNAERGRTEASFTNLGIKKVPIQKKFTDNYPKILTGGIWAIVSIGYLAPAGNESPWIVENIKPIQISSIDFEEFLKLREEFSTDEWIQLLMQTLGLNIEQFSKTQQLLQLTRLIPFCERNFNLMELGPKGTGKSHVFSEFSPHGILISGGEVSTSNLFVNNRNNSIGLVGVWDTVAFDEFAGKDKKVPKDMVDIMKNYMANKSFSRGKESIGAEGSMVFIGNTKRSVPYMMKHADLFEPLPKSYYDSAFLDRIHFYLPGWRVDIIRGDMFSDEYGFIVDYYAEILHYLRSKDYSLSLPDLFRLDSTLSERDRVAIFKTYSGLMKILFPHNKYDTEEARQILEFAMEGRRRVKVQLEKMDETFRENKAEFKYMYNGNNIEVVTLEEIEFNQQNIVEDDEEVKSSHLKPPTPLILKEESILIKDGQKGISYKKLFANYLKGASEIHVSDPYLRKFHQIKNLFDFVEFLIGIKPIGEEITLKVSTAYDSSVSDQEANLMKLEESLEGSGINFHYDFDIDDSPHERFIDADNGWTIILGRGLDIFHVYDFKNPFNLANNLQEERNCKDFFVTYKKS